MKRKDYEKPMMEVIHLRHQTQLLTVSGVKAVRKRKDEDEKIVEDYGQAEVETWE